MGKGQNERKMLPTAITEEYPSLPIEKKRVITAGDNKSMGSEGLGPLLFLKL